MPVRRLWRWRYQIVRCYQLTRVDRDGLHRALSSMQDGQVEGGRDPPVGEERQPLDQLLIDFDRVSAGGLHLVHSRQRERPIEGDALACRAHGVVSLELLSLVETALGLAAPRLSTANRTHFAGRCPK